MMRREVSPYYGTLHLEGALALLAGGLRVAAGAPPIGVDSERFRNAFSASMGGHPAFAYGSGRSALFEILRAAGIGEGDEVLLPGLTCAVVPNAILYVGARPVYVDIDPRDYNIDVTNLEAKITPRSRMVIAQHTWGVPADLRGILAVARSSGLLVVEDCALAQGAVWDGRPVGTMGDASIFSMDFSKTITTGWGGVALAPNEELADKLARAYRRVPAPTRLGVAHQAIQAGVSGFLYAPRVYPWAKRALWHLTDWGLFRRSTRPEEYWARIPSGYLHRLGEPQSRAGIQQLERLPGIVARSRELADRYRAVSDAAGVASQRCLHPEAMPTHFQYPLLLDDGPAAVRFFRSRGIELGRGFGEVFYQHPRGRAYCYEPGECPESEFVARHVVNLPTHPRLKLRDIDLIETTLREYLTVDRARAETVGAEAS